MIRRRAGGKRPGMLHTDTNHLNSKQKAAQGRAYGRSEGWSDGAREGLS
jgi:hypothetical protein